MSHEIEADYIEDYHNEDKHCVNCDSCRPVGEGYYCAELETEISGRGTCDFFRLVE